MRRSKWSGALDTVGALGIPALAGDPAPAQYCFLDTTLHPDVHHAVHAVSIDERRRQFPSTLWTSVPVPPQTLEQVYFCGVHADVGGGYPEEGSTELSHHFELDDLEGATPWPAIRSRRAGALSVAFSKAAALDPKHESWSLIPWLAPESRVIAPDATMANSVDTRLAGDPSYRPSNVHLLDGTLAAGYGSETVVL